MKNRFLFGSVLAFSLAFWACGDDTSSTSCISESSDSNRFPPVAKIHPISWVSGVFTKITATPAKFQHQAFTTKSTTLQV